MNLATANPELSKEWHSTKNGDLTPFDVTPGSNKKAWWKCSKKHEWEATINNRSNSRGCPYCSNKKVCNDNCLATLSPELAQEWHPKNKKTPFDVTLGSHETVWWMCLSGHAWEALVYSRSNGRGCPYCSNQKVCNDNCLATLNSELSKEWHPTKNGSLIPFDVIISSGIKAWWICSTKGHGWEATIAHRTNGRGCPYCSNKKVCNDNCLATLNPELSKEWHPTKNGNLTPSDVSPYSNKKAWWTCATKGHEWEAVIASRSNGNSCPHCSEFKTEKKCRGIFETIFDKSFPKNRKALGCRLELDGYCEELKLAFEYNGQQHYRPHYLWHRKSGTFAKQQARDRLKARLCKEKGIELIVIPYIENHRLEEFIRENLDQIEECSSDLLNNIVRSQD